ncbi:MAG: GNAT family N-acetyltransferase, partial [Candidatus Latescibacterota bacterium]
EEDHMPADLDRKIRGILVECFPHNTDHYAQTRDWHSKPVWVVVGLAPDGTVAAHCAMVEREVKIAGMHRVTVAGVQGFSVRRPWQGTGLSDRLMARALDEARKRGIGAGLLFCLPQLERLYERMGWRAVHHPVTMRDEMGNPEPLPEKNIAMAIPLNIDTFPGGAINLRGPDW